MALERQLVRSERGRYARDVWLLDGPTQRKHRLCLFLDAEFYLEQMGTVDVLDRLVETGTIPPTSFAFVSQLDMASRHEDFLWNPSYAEFIAGDVVPWIRARRPMIMESDNVICGMSLSGLASAHVSLSYPTVFTRCLSQSGSFWWLLANEVSVPRADVKLWLSVGDRETDTLVSHPPTGLFQELSQIEGVEAAVARFRAIGATVTYNLYPGDHGWASWRDELEPALTWLLHPND